MKISESEFSAVVATIVKGGVAAASEYPEEVVVRVALAVGAVLKQRQGLPDTAVFAVPSDAIQPFLASMNKRQRRLLKEIAEGLEIVARDRIH